MDVPILRYYNINREWGWRLANKTGRLRGGVQRESRGRRPAPPERVRRSSDRPKL